MPTTAKPRYLQLADDLRRDLVAGKFTAGFPTEQVLTDRFKVSRFTVREALRTLQDEGMISRRRGSGTTVEPAVTRGGALHQPLSNVGELLQYAHDTHFDFARVPDSGIPPWIEVALGMEHGGRWVRFRGIRKDAGGVPIAVIDAFVQARLEHLADELRTDAGPIFRQLEKLSDVRVLKVTQDIQACAASNELASELAIAPGSPVLRIIRCYWHNDSEVFEISVNHHPGDRFAYAVHFDAEG